MCKSAYIHVHTKITVWVCLRNQVNALEDKITTVFIGKEEKLSMWEKQEEKQPQGRWVWGSDGEQVTKDHILDIMEAQEGQMQGERKATHWKFLIQRDKYW
jgi:hypothetical protein